MKRMIFRVAGSIALWVLAFTGSEAFGQQFTYRVSHDHMIGSCKGELVVNQEGIEYRADDKKHARKWAYVDIEMIKLESAREIEIITYDGVWLKLGRDRAFHFKVREGSVDKQASDFLLARVGRPMATSFVKSDDPQYAIPVRHRHNFGGDQGTLKIYADGVSYESTSVKSSRRWRWMDIESISRTGPYQFAITTYEPKFGGPTKTFNFDLKERMDDEVYDYLWARVYKITLPASVESKQ